MVSALEGDESIRVNVGDLNGGFVGDVDGYFDVVGFVGDGSS